MYFAVWILFLIAGLLFGGAWAAYNNRAKLLTIVAALLGAISFAAAVAWMISEMK